MNNVTAKKRSDSVIFFFIKIMSILGMIFLIGIPGAFQYSGTYFFYEKNILKIPDGLVYKISKAQGRSGSAIYFSINDIEYISKCPIRLYKDTICNDKNKNNYFLGENVIFIKRKENNSSAYGLITNGIFTDQFKKITWLHMETNDANNYNKKNNIFDIVYMNISLLSLILLVIFALVIKIIKVKKQ